MKDENVGYVVTVDVGRPAAQREANNETVPMVDYVEILLALFYEISDFIIEGRFDSWWATRGRADAVEYGDTLVELGVFERHPNGEGNQHFYRRKTRRD